MVDVDGSLVALVSAERLEQMHRFAKRQATDFLEQQKSGPLTDEQAVVLGLKAQSWARKKTRPTRRKTD